MNRLYELIAKVLEEDVAKIGDESSPETLENWDSFNGLVLADELEKEFSISFSLEEITDVRCVADIKRHLRNHGVEIDGEG